MAHEEQAHTSPPSRLSSDPIDEPLLRLSSELSLSKLPISSFGMDIGGSLTKICFFCKSSQHDDIALKFDEKVLSAIHSEKNYGQTGVRDHNLEFNTPYIGGHLYFMRFESSHMDAFISMVQEQDFSSETVILCCTGGGSIKYGHTLEQALKTKVHKSDELTCLLIGINFLLRHFDGELFCVDHKTFMETGAQLPPPPPNDSIFPYLLLNIGSGVSIIRVNKDGSHHRVGGSALGGATFLGLAEMLTDVTNFDQAMSVAETGNSANIDLLVSDIYGGNCEDLGLPADLVASSLGKLIRNEVRKNAKQCDILAALLSAITYNLASLAWLHARLQNLTTVVFAGNFLRGNKISIKTLAYALNFWSTGSTRALFLKHEGYCGALGALINGAMGNIDSLEHQLLQPK